MYLPSRRFLLLQSGYFVFSLSGIFLKSGANFPVLSPGFLLRYGASLLCVFFFALLWQQVLREYELMTAYAWRGVLFLWTFLWSALFFQEAITARNLAGAGIIVAGMMLAARDD